MFRPACRDPVPEQRDFHQRVFGCITRRLGRRVSDAGVTLGWVEIGRWERAVRIISKGRISPQLELYRCVSSLPPSHDSLGLGVSEGWVGRTRASPHDSPRLFPTYTLTPAASRLMVFLHPHRTPWQSLPWKRNGSRNDHRDIPLLPTLRGSFAMPLLPRPKLPLPVVVMCSRRKRLVLHRRKRTRLVARNDVVVHPEREQIR